LHCTQSKEAKEFTSPQGGRLQQPALCVLSLALTIKFKIQVQLLKFTIQELGYNVKCEAVVSLRQLR
jgi:hypothetical protein